MASYAPYSTLGAVCAEVRAHGLEVSLSGDPELPVRGTACDSRSVEKGNVFVCKGAAFRPEFLTSALESGAVAYLCDEAHADALAATAPGVPCLVAADLRPAMAYASAEAWGHPDQKLDVLGITGTKGKTTTAFLLRSVIDALDGHPCGFIGTHGVFDGVRDLPSANTTPEAPDLWRFLASAAEAGCHHMVMEVSSQALKYDRTLGLHLAVGCFLNIGLDHISPSEHPTFEDYLASKLRIFRQAKACVTNLDVDHAQAVMDALVASGRPSVTYALEPVTPVGLADVTARDIAARGTHMDFTAVTPDWAAPLSEPLAGEFNVSNALAAIACLCALGVAPAKARAACEQGLPDARVPGRMEVHRTADGQVTVLVDYAHNELSYLRFFEAVDQVWPGVHRTALFGVCGGKALNRYVELPVTAAAHADLLVVTSDEPGPCDPAQLVHEVAGNVPAGTQVIEQWDRQKALDQAFRLAVGRARATGEPQLVCALGKGFEDTMRFGNEDRPIEPDTEHAARLVAEYDADPQAFAGEKDAPSR